MSALAPRAAVLLVLLAGSCAAKAAKPRPAAPPPPGAEAPLEPTVVAYGEYRDPLRPVNRAIFAFNHVVYRFLLIPLSKGYEKAAPKPVRRSISRFFDNLRTPIYLANHLLQLEAAAAGRTTARFLVNSTAGIGGLYDPARDWLGFEREESHLSDTMARYGIGYGVYLVLPVLGPSDLRGGVSLGVETFMSPIPYVLGNPESTAVRGFDSFQEFAPYAERYETLRRKAEDPYIFFRNLHLQGVQRDAAY